MDMVVLAHIKEQSRLSLGSYGRPRMTEELKEAGVDVGHRRVGRLMRENGIVVERTRKFKATTDSDHTFNIAPNLLDSDFTASVSRVVVLEAARGAFGVAQSAAVGDAGGHRRC
jgi:transposase InsO family protein